MNRQEEYELLMKELEETPARLAYTNERLQAKIKSRRWQKWLGIPVGTVIGSLLGFTILVNSVPVFAQSCSHIPLIKELAELVDFSSSLTAAVENEYVQPIELEQTQNDITVRVEYLIVDQKQVNVFYSLDSEKYEKMDMTPSIYSLEGENLQGYSISSGNHDTPNGELNYITIDFVEEDVPSELKLEMEVHDNGAGVYEEEIIPDGEDGRVHELIEDDYEAPQPISTFNFNLTFDPQFTAKGEKISLNQPFILDGQKLILEDVEIYPSHMRLNFEDEVGNTAYLKSMSYYIENEKGKRFDKIKNGITASGKEGSPMMASYRLESTFFSKSKSLTLYITGTEWVDKDKQKVKLDLVHQTAEDLPEGVTFEKAERKENGWLLTFGAIEYKENHMYDLWGSQYYDEAGNEYEYHSWSSTMGYMDEEKGEYIKGDGMFYTEIPLVDYMEETVYMSPSFSRHIQLDEPVVIKIK